MIKSVLENIVKKRNPGFCFDKNITDRMIISFALGVARRLFRGLKVLWIGHNPKGLMMGKNVSIKFGSRVKWGSFLKLGDGVELSGLGTEGITMGHHVGIGSNSKLVTSTTFNNIGKKIQIGDNVGIGEFAYLGGAGGLEIGSDCIIGQYFSCHPENHYFGKSDRLIRLQGTHRKGIKIGENCWIGSKVSILDGVEIGQGCVIASGTVVTKSFPPNSILSGVPARLMKNRKARVTSWVVNPF